MKTYTLAQAGIAVEKLEGEMRQAALRGIRSAAARGVQVIIAQIIPSRTPQPVDRGVYRAGWRQEATPGGADIFNAEPHAAHIEHGVRAERVKIGRALISALATWALRKRLAKGPAEAVGLAWAIARAMQRRGIFGQGLKVLAELVEKRLPAILREEVERELGKVAL